MGLLRAFISLWRGTADRDAFLAYQTGLLDWARDVHGLTRDEYAAQFERRYVSADDRDLFFEYLLAASKEAPSYVTDHPRMLDDRRRLFERFGLPVLTMRELRDLENDRLRRMNSPLRL
ncbi:MAG: hypothetical protein L6Q92_12325 [Phycisphaerae bacterium]|nr:hypothetical protein [Phycisphaerae bacterium]